MSYSKQSHITLQKHTLEKYKQLLDQQGFEYVGGYERNTSPMAIKCKVCGAERTVTGDYLGRAEKQGRYTAVRCRNCEEINAHAKDQDLKRKQQIKNKMPKLSKQHYQQSSAFILTCEVCGKTFISKKEERFCSEECRKKHYNQLSWRNRQKRIRDALVDKDITLEKVYRNDRGICYLCGGKCDYDDFTVINDTIICGNNYPSIEHVIPLSRGGKHSWDNVRLAHRLCNSLKSDSETIPPC